MRTVIFVCTGNTCRSPMAEAIANRHFRDRGDDALAVSAGVWAGEGCPTSRETVRALSTLGIEFDGRSTPLSSQMASEASLVLCMTREHLRGVQELLAAGGHSGDHVHLLSDLGDIADPVGSSQDVYDELSVVMAQIIPRRLDHLLPRESIVDDE